MDRGEFSVSGHRVVGWDYDRWRRLISGNRLSWLVFMRATCAVVFLACDRSANTGHVAVPRGQDLRRALVIGLSVSSVEPMSFAVDAESLIHKLYGVLCTAHPYRSQRRSLE